MMERNPFRPRKIVDYSKFADNDSDSDDFAQPVSKKNKVKHQVVDPTTVKNLNLAKSTSTAKRTNKTADIKAADKPKIKDVIAKIKNDDDDFITIDSDENSQKNGSKDQKSNVEETKKIVVEVSDLFAKKEIAKSEIKKSEVQLIKCEVPSVTTEPNKKNDEKVKTDSCHLKVSEDEKRSPEINKSIKSKRKEKNTSVEKQTDMVDVSISKPTAPLIEDKETTKISKQSKESNHLEFSENVDQQTNIRKWKPPTRTVAKSEPELKSPLSTSNSGLRLGLSRNIRTKPLHSNVKIQS